MKKTSRLNLFLLCAALCLALTGCAKRESIPAQETVPEPYEEEEEDYGPEIILDQEKFDAAVQALLSEYVGLRESGMADFDENAHPQLPWYAAVVASYDWNSLYYALHDFDANGVPELIVSAGMDDYQQPVGIYAFDGQDMVYLCPEQSLGERASVTYEDELFFVRGSGSASTGAVTVYRIAPDGYGTEIIEIMDYEFLAPDNVVYTPRLGGMSVEEFLSHDFLGNFDVPVDYNRFVTSLSGSPEADMPNPWSDALTPEEAAHGAVLDCFILPEVIGCADFTAEDRQLSYTDGLAQAMYYNGSDTLVIRKGAGVQDVSGDYNAYPETRDVVFKGLTIQCLGQDGAIRLARWSFGDHSFSLSFNAGDLSRPGLDEQDVTSLVGQIQ